MKQVPVAGDRGLLEATSNECRDRRQAEPRPTLRGEGDAPSLSSAGVSSEVEKLTATAKPKRQMQMSSDQRSVGQRR
jgi:hypothetical protein